jgi:hypothetical protein
MADGGTKADAGTPKGDGGTTADGGAPMVVDVCRTPDGGTQANTVVICTWCECDVPALIKNKKLETTLKAGASGDLIKKLHDHLKRFGMTIELSDWKDASGKFEESADVSKSSWGAPTTRAVRMFGLHPAVGADTARILKTDGKTITTDLATKIRDWCRGKISSPKFYWQFKNLQIKSGDLDAAGAHAAPEKQTVFHDFIVQIEKDLTKTGFAAHSDSLCDIGADHKPKGVFEAAKTNAAGKHEDKALNDLPYLIRKFQRQAQWLWRMKADGKHQPDASASDASVYVGSSTGEVDDATAKALHAWSEQGLHMVIKKFELEGMSWPPSGGGPITNAPGSSQAKLRKDAYDVWLQAAEEIHKQGATIQGPYASSPRGWAGGKPTDASASPFSWHYSGLAIDLSESLQLSDGTISDSKPYGLEKDGNKFRIWCRVVPQPAKPADPADDKTDAVKQYRNRNIKYKHDRGTANEKVKASDPADPAPLYFATTDKDASGTDVKEVTAKEGWYVDVTAIMESKGMMRIPRHAN